MATSRSLCNREGHGPRLLPILLSLLLSYNTGVEAFFIRHSSGNCFVPATWTTVTGVWGKHYPMFLNDKCLEDRAQYTFYSNDCLHNKKNKACLSVYKKTRFISYETFYMYEKKTVGEIPAVCTDARAMKQTAGGSLWMKQGAENTKKSRCVAQFTEKMTKSGSIIPKYQGKYFMQATLRCDGEDQRFSFASITCDGNSTEKVSCPTKQVITINRAFYGASTEFKTCGSTGTQSCTVDVTCEMKQICDGRKSCENVAVNNTLFPLDPCGDVEKKYLYFDYQCFNNTVTKDRYNDTLCTRDKPGLVEQLPPSRFTSSANLDQTHNAARAKLSSSTSWCAPCGTGNYLQIDLGKPHIIYSVTILGDRVTNNLVRAFQLNYTVDFIDWREAFTNQIFPETIGGFDQTVTKTLSQAIAARFVRFIPVYSYNNSCMRVEICGYVQYPDTPRNFILNSKTSKSVSVSWTAPVEGGDGGVTGYEVIVTRTDTMTEKNYAVEKEKKDFTTSDPLKPFAPYTISIATKNKHGLSNVSVLSFTTDQDVPSGPPLNMTTSTLNSSAITVQWTMPEQEQQNGIITNYTVCLSRSDQDCQYSYITNNNMIIIGNLNSSTRYYIKVSAGTKIGFGKYTEYREQITSGAPLEPPINKTDSTLVFTLQEPLEGYTICFVIAMKLNDKDLSVKPSIEFRTEEFVNYTTANASDTPLPYIAARLELNGETSFGEHFVLGDNRNSSSRRRKRSIPTGDFYNGPLKDGQYYIVFQRFFDIVNDFYSSEWTTPARTNIILPPTLPSTTTTKPTTTTKTTESSTRESIPPERSESGGSNTGTVIAAVVPVILVILILVVAVVFIMRRRRDRSGKRGEQSNMTMANIAEEEEEKGNVDESGLHNNANGNEDFEEEVGGLYSNQSEIELQQHGDIPIARLALHIKDMEKDQKFKKEFEQLPVGKHFKWDISARSFNKEKNRYANVATYDHSRVVLNGGETMDYINASYVDGITEKYYIATQGPKPVTINDFWRMVFEKKCPTIIMVTELVETGKRKCEQYWPDEKESATYGQIQVINIDTKRYADHSCREFMLEKDGERHEVRQFHFQSWPDHGAPQYPTQLLTFRSHYKAYQQTRVGPVLVHCSAGVGRTGVFIAIDKIIDDIEKNNIQKLNIYNTVKHLRTRRINMVQVLEQYEFIHTALLDYISCGINEVDSTNISIEINKLSRKSARGRTGFQDKFMRLNDVSPTFPAEECDAALLPANRTKNRSKTIYPPEAARVPLRHVTDIENSDYINACFVDGYLGKNFFIATQTPLENTINDFWRMVYQVQSSTIVMLNQLRESGQEYPMFWPTEKTKPCEYGSIMLTLNGVKKKGNAITRKFLISPSHNTEEHRTIRIIQYIAWPDHDVPSKAEDVLALLAQVEESQRAGDKAPIIVVCSDGAGRSGTYIATSNVVDRMKAMQAVDVFQAIKLIRTKRPQFVENEMQYQFCYTVAEAVLKSFSDYSNFEELRGHAE